MDFVDTFVSATDGAPSPRLFRQWSAISILAASLERRVWCHVIDKPTYPNLYVLLVGSAGIGKNMAIGPARELLTSAECGIHIAPSSVTSAALIDCVAEAHRGHNGEAYHPLSFISSEFSTVMPEYDKAIMSTFCDLYDNEPTYDWKRRTQNGGLTQTIIRPQLNILGGTTPSFLGSMMPEIAWSMGFTSRVILVYCGEGVKMQLFSQIQPPDMSALREGLRKVVQMSGCFGWTPEAMQEISTWHSLGELPVPDHSRLLHYCSRRILHATKLCMLSSVSRGRDLIIEREDVVRAIGWLCEAEDAMPDCFRDMTGSGDSMIISDVVSMMRRSIEKTKTPVPGDLITEWISKRSPCVNVTHILDIACRSGQILRIDGTNDFIPRPKEKETPQ